MKVAAEAEQGSVRLSYDYKHFFFRKAYTDLFTIKQVMCIKKAVRDHFDIIMTIHIVCSTGVGSIKEHQDRNG